MKRLVLLATFAAGSTIVAGCSGGSNSVPAAPIANSPSAIAPAGASRMTDFQAGLASGRFARVCAAAVAGEASCHAIIRTDTGEGRSPQGKPGPGPGPVGAPAGFGPSQLQGAYGLVGAPAPTVTVAVVDAYDNPNLEADLGVYRSQYGIPACTTANGCFKKVGQTGTATLPTTNASWGQETSLDVDMVSANCPTCHILVVEANSPTSANLAAGVDTAVALGAVAIGNSYGSAESAGESAYAASYNHPGVAITASSGDAGYGAQSPASYNTIIATGGTSLTVSGTSYASETAWSGAGSGCSAYELQQSWQSGAPAAACTKRVIADVSYDADPNTGVAVYDSFAYRRQSGWLVFGGTSVASPAIAAIYARGGNLAGYPAQYTYAHAAGLHDVVGGSNGTCSATYLCNAVTGYDGPTGLGSPNGVTAF